jgi:hypothetical protein
LIPPIESQVAQQPQTVTLQSYGAIQFKPVDKSEDGDFITMAIELLQQKEKEKEKDKSWL